MHDVATASKRPQKPGPADAMRLLLDPERHLAAADIAAHPAYHHADARSRGWDGRRLVDFYKSTTKSERAALIGQLVQLDPKSFAERVPPLLVKVINEPGKKVPWGPWGDPYFTETCDDDLYGLLGAEKPRQVVVPCPLRRMLDTLFTDVLVDTSDVLLQPCAWAYRPGRVDPVPRVIQEVRQAVREGARYWAKLDIKSFFPSMPWALIRSALTSFPFWYLDEFVERVMALVQTPLVDAKGNTIPNDSGSQAGIRISGVIANIVLWPLDVHVPEEFDVRYWRYSDDIIILGHERHHVVGAVRFVRRWCQEQGLRLKGVAP